MIFSSTIKRLHEAGASLEAIIIAVEAIEMEMDARRLAQAERSRRYRASRHVTQRDVTQTPSQVSPLGYNPPSSPPPSEPNGSVSETSSDVQSVAKKARKKTEYPSDFLEFWKIYPTDSNMSKAEAFSEWKKLSAEDRIDATASVPGFCDYCAANKDYRPIHANRYLKKRRFEGHLAKAAEVANWREVRVSDPNWNAWLAFYRDNGRKFMAKVMQEKADKGESFRVPSTWPAGTKQQEHAA